MKTLPKFIVHVLKALQEASEKLQHKILDWETVLRITRKAVRSYGIQELAGIQVFVVASFLGYLGMVRIFRLYFTIYRMTIFQKRTCPLPCNSTKIKPNQCYFSNVNFN